jgi:hypothetical protein
MSAAQRANYVYQRTNSSQDNAEAQASLRALALELPESVYDDHKRKVLAALTTEQLRAANAEEEVRKLKGCIWKMVEILGFDQDGANYTHLVHPDIISYGIGRATEARADYDAALDESND